MFAQRWECAAQVDWRDPCIFGPDDMTSSMSAPTFGVVVLNWNNAHDTVPCLDSLYEANPRPRHAVVVDTELVALRQQL